MPAHHWSSKIHSSSCSRCGAIRTKMPAGAGWSYRLPDGFGSLVTRPKCDRASESRRTRKMGRRAKVLSRSRAGSPRLRSREYYARLAKATSGDAALFKAWREGEWVAGDPDATVKIRITTAEIPPAGPVVRAEVVDGVLHIITTEVIHSAQSFSVGAVNQKGTI